MDGLGRSRDPATSLASSILDAVLSSRDGVYASETICSPRVARPNAPGRGRPGGIGRQSRPDAGGRVLPFAIGRHSRPDWRGRARPEAFGRDRRGTVRCAACRAALRPGSLARQSSTRCSLHENDPHGDVEREPTRGSLEPAPTWFRHPASTRLSLEPAPTWFRHPASTRLSLEPAQTWAPSREESTASAVDEVAGSPERPSTSRVLRCSRSDPTIATTNAR